MRLRNPVVLGLALSGVMGAGLVVPPPAVCASPSGAANQASAVAGPSAHAAQADAGKTDTGSAEASAGGQAVSICFKPQPGAARDTLLVIPSGTVLVGRTVLQGRKGAQMEAVVTTETVTLTEMQPCSGADASTLVSHTRHWEVDPVRPQAAVVLQPVGEVSGNGVDTTFSEEPESFRNAIKNGAITAHVQGTLKETVALTETQADIPQAPESASGPDWAHATGWDQNILRKTPGSRTE